MLNSQEIGEQRIRTISHIFKRLSHGRSGIRFVSYQLYQRKSSARFWGVIRVPTTRLIVNGKPRDLNVDPAMPLLWALREQLGLTGAKFGCGMALCGACTVHVDGTAVRSCVTPVGV